MRDLTTADIIPDPNMREIGSLNRENTRRLLASLAIYPLIERLDMSRPQFDVLVALARNEADNHAIKAYFPLCVPAISQESFCEDFHSDS